PHSLGLAYPTPVPSLRILTCSREASRDCQRSRTPIRCRTCSRNRSHRCEYTESVGDLLSGTRKLPSNRECCKSRGSIVSYGRYTSIYPEGTRSGCTTSTRTNQGNAATEICLTVLCVLSCTRELPLYAQ